MSCTKVCYLHSETTVDWDTPSNTALNTLDTPSETNVDWDTPSVTTVVLDDNQFETNVDCDSSSEIPIEKYDTYVDFTWFQVDSMISFIELPFHEWSHDDYDYDCIDKYLDNERYRYEDVFIDSLEEWISVDTWTDVEVRLSSYLKRWNHLREKERQIEIYASSLVSDVLENVLFEFEVDKMCKFLHTNQDSGICWNEETYQVESDTFLKDSLLVHAQKHLSEFSEYLNKGHKFLVELSNSHFTDEVVEDYNRIVHEYIRLYLREPTVVSVRSSRRETLPRFELVFKDKVLLVIEKQSDLTYNIVTCFVKIF